MVEEVITGQLGKAPDLARYVAERVVLRTKDVRHATRRRRWTGLRVVPDKFPSSEMYIIKPSEQLQLQRN